MFLIYCGEYRLTAQWSSPLFLWSAAVILFLSTTSLLQELLLQNVNAADEIIPHEQTSPYEFLHTGTKNLTSRSNPLQSHPSPTQSFSSFHSWYRQAQPTQDINGRSFRYLYVIPLRASSILPIALGELHKTIGCHYCIQSPVRVLRNGLPIADEMSYIIAFRFKWKDKFPRQTMALGVLLIPVPLDA